MKLFINALLFLAVANLYAQNSIKGTVVDANTKQGLMDASVYFIDIEKGTSTNENGNFKIENLPSGNYKILVSILGYETKSVNLKIPNITNLEISLNPSAIEMEAIIVSTPFHKLQSDNVMKVEHETIKNLKANGAVNLSDGITNIAGVESITTGLSIGKPVIRGLSSNRVLVYAQGVRLENQQFGDEHGLGLSDSGIESVEVIKGPASLLYGSDALGGVLYLNPEKFAESNTSHADFNGNYFSNTQGFNTNVGYKSSDDHFKFLFRGSLAEHADYKTDDYRVTNTRFREQDFKAGMGYQNNNFKTEFRYNVNNSKLGIPEGIGEQSTLKTPLLPYQNITNHIFSSKSTVFLNNSRLDINLGYLYNDRKEFEEHHHDEDEDEHEEEHEEDHDDEILEAALHMKLKTANYDVKYNLPELGKFETIVGVQGMNQVNSNYGEEQLIPNATTNDIGVLATSHIHFEKVGIQFGARFDNRNIKVVSGLQKDFNSFNGAFGIKTDIFKKFTARVNLATGFRAPNLSELTSDGSHEGTNRYEVGNPDLKSEQNFQTDIALEFKNEHVEFFINGFYNKINNYIFLSPNGNTINEDPVYLYLQDDANLYGGEIGLHFHPHPLDWLHIESSFETVTGEKTDDTYLPLIPANSLTNLLRVEFEKTWLKKGYSFVKLTTTFSQNNISAFETSSSGYSLLSAGIVGSFNLFKNEATVTLSGTNLTNKAYINHLSRLKPDNIYNMGTNITFGLTYNL
ncbi:iron complex outermembrane receptor protein [Mariniflexile fucanivorans]|uniref:Iron complex outermembrane receptor protein n=1 Tax=Mariniflexile fucanivorans TaxID=264023 RepID=A0A4R1RQ60_9FLAO|nr:TonB-dependent receptor [Mariniflexile fucanivorans]TCL68032.1 iron complex outermembrane receptor protein [Mariniflexile fucanivorans]